MKVSTKTLNFGFEEVQMISEFKLQSGCDFIEPVHPEYQNILYIWICI